jgi:putative intracellular protease/amidase
VDESLTGGPNQYLSTWKESIAMKRRTMLVLAVILVAIVALILSAPAFLRFAGLHPHYKGKIYHLAGKRALIVTTSHGVLGTTGKATGVYASEMTIPYYEFLGSGMAVDVASIEGGVMPIEPLSLRWPFATPADRRFLSDPSYRVKAAKSIPIADLDFARYDVVYMAGGWGAAWDLGTSDVLGRKVSEAYAKGVIMGSVCHGALGFLKAAEPDGKPLVKGRHMTAVTDKQVRELGIEITPLHPETELRKAGALFESSTSWRDIFANHVVIDGTIVTGQNQNAGAEVAQDMMMLLSKKGSTR